MSQYHMECFACTIWDLFILKKKKVFIVYLRINWASCLLLGNPTWFLWRPRLFVNYWLTVSSASTSMSVCAFVCSFPWDPTEERGCQSREGQCAALASEAWINLGGGHGPEAVVGAPPILQCHAGFSLPSFVVMTWSTCIFERSWLTLCSPRALSDCSLEPVPIFSRENFSPSYSYYFEAWHQHA